MSSISGHVSATYQNLFKTYLICLFLSILKTFQTKTLPTKVPWTPGQYVACLLVSFVTCKFVPHTSPYFWPFPSDVHNTLSFWTGVAYMVPLYSSVVWVGCVVELLSGISFLGCTLCPPTPKWILIYSYNSFMAIPVSTCLLILPNPCQPLVAGASPFGFTSIFPSVGPYKDALFIVTMFAPVWPLGWWAAHGPPGPPGPPLVPESSPQIYSYAHPYNILPPSASVSLSTSPLPLAGLTQNLPPHLIPYQWHHFSCSPLPCGTMYCCL